MCGSRIVYSDRFGVLGLWVCIGLLLSACAARAPSSSFAVPDNIPQPTLHPDRVTTGDVVEVAYFMYGGTEAEAYKIGVADVLRVRVANHDNLNPNDIVVLPDGSAPLDQIGSILAAGQTVAELAERCKEAYQAIGLSTPRVVVSVVAGQQRLRQFMRFLGADEGGNKVTLKVFDNEALDFPLIPPVSVNQSIDDIREEVRQAYDKEFGPRLAVTVNLLSRSVPALYVMGEVRVPGAQALDRPVNLMTAVAMAGGFAETAAKGEVLVVRFDAEGNYRHWQFDLRDGSIGGKGLNSNFLLLSNDVVYVSRSRIAEVNLFVRQYIRGLMPLEAGVGVAVPID